MNIIKFTSLLILILTLNSCSEREFMANETEFENIEENLKEKFGNDSYYTDIKVGCNEQKELEVTVTVTEKPAMFKMEGWELKEGSWKQINNVQLQLDKGEITNYMFQLGNEVSVAMLGKLVVESKNEIIEMNPTEKLKLNYAYVAASILGEKNEMKYQIQLKSTIDNTEFDFCYDLNGQKLLNY